jgi:hypothetical protein
MPVSTPSLFDDDPAPVPVHPSLARRSTRLGDSKKSKAVNRLLAQVESLRERLEQQKRRLDEALIFHAAHVRPRQEHVIALRTDAVRVLARFLDDRRLTKADKRVLRAILIEQMDEILAHVATPDPDLAKLFERLHGVGFDEAVQSDLDDVRSDMAGFFADLGIDMELPDLRPGMTEEELAVSAAQMADRMRQLHDVQVESAPGRRKAKRELREDQRAERYEQVRKISIGAIYKRLVKVLHPDLEPDPSIRQQKCALMQEVTTAYGGNDLHTLLRLELEWIDGAGADAARQTDETLSACAEVLREQAAALRAGIMELPFQPRYASLAGASDPFGIADVIDGPAEANRLDTIIEGLSAGLERLRDERLALAEVRELIQLDRQSRRWHQRKYADSSSRASACHDARVGATDSASVKRERPVLQRDL